LSQRLDEIETYLQNRYNFLTFDPSHVSILPPGSLPMVTIEGNPPNQVLSMLIPQGMPGIQGPVGAAGGTGIIGNPGKAGPDGKVGIWELPTQYENTYSTV